MALLHKFYCTHTHEIKLPGVLVVFVAENAETEISAGYRPHEYRIGDMAHLIFVTYSLFVPIYFQILFIIIIYFVRLEN